MGTEGDQKTAAQPKRLGRYRSLMLIGEGGMGRVELALETGDGGFERVVALKRMRPEIAKDARHTEMFLHEARLAALLSHPNVVHTLAFGEADGELYLAMEYVQGETLTAILDRCKSRGKKVDFDLGLEILEHVCLALHAAHELRDVQDKPLGLVVAGGLSYDARLGRYLSLSPELFATWMAVPNDDRRQDIATQMGLRLKLLWYLK